MQGVARPAAMVQALQSWLLAPGYPLLFAKDPQQGADSAASWLDAGQLPVQLWAEGYNVPRTSAQTLWHLPVTVR